MFSYEAKYDGIGPSPSRDRNSVQSVSWTRNYANYPFQTTAAYANMLADLARRRRDMELGRQQADIQAKLAEAERDRKSKIKNTEKIADAETLGHRMKQMRFNEIWSALGDGRTKVGGFLGDVIGEVQRPNNVELPEFDLRKIYSQGDIQQMVNAQQADISAKAAQRMQQIAEQMGGRGIGASSPAVMARQMSSLANSIAEGTEADRRTRMEKFMENEDHLTNALQAAERQYAALQQNNIRRDRNRINLIGSLGSYIG